MHLRQLIVAACDLIVMASSDLPHYEIQKYYQSTSKVHAQILQNLVVPRLTWQYVPEKPWTHEQPEAVARPPCKHAAGSLKHGWTLQAELKPGLSPGHMASLTSLAVSWLWHETLRC